MLGTRLYNRFGGFEACVAAITIVYALILPALLLVPRQLIATPDNVTGVDDAPQRSWAA
jgi:hypothetical protein